MGSDGQNRCRSRYSARTVRKEHYDVAAERNNIVESSLCIKNVLEHCMGKYHIELSTQFLLKRFFKIEVQKLNILGHEIRHPVGAINIADDIPISRSEIISVCTALFITILPTRNIDNVAREIRQVLSQDIIGKQARMLRDKYLFGDSIQAPV